MAPLVSVLMPALNEEKVIARTIGMVLAQDGVDVEVLVVHGQSVDRTADIVSEIAKGDPRVRLIPNPRNIIPVALNIGLAQAAGPYIARIDAHADLAPGYLRRGVEWLEKNPKLASVGGLRRGAAFTRVGRTIGLCLSSPYAIGNSLNHFGTEAQLTDHASFAVVRTDAARQVDGWDETLLVNEDVDFDHRLIQAGYQIGFDPEMLVGWHVQETIPRLFRQYRRYGRGKAQMILKNGSGAIRLRHLVPPAFVVGSGLILLAGVVKPGLWLLLSPYAALVGVASAKQWRKRGDEDVSLPALPASFVAIHVGWGLGMLEGLLLRRGPQLASGNGAVKVAQTA
ncbi:MAG TPA: glycosyltransferase [Arachnia sp.]|nr:glycosyltransferase [Arachnia sp.]HMT85210.1 glycosyltransferase [Arachnia sp.]